VVDLRPSVTPARLTRTRDHPPRTITGSQGSTGVHRTRCHGTPHPGEPVGPGREAQKGGHCSPRIARGTEVADAPGRSDQDSRAQDRHAGWDHSQGGAAIEAGPPEPRSLHPERAEPAGESGTDRGVVVTHSGPGRCGRPLAAPRSEALVGHDADLPGP
jgi:hypothetical protein